MILTAVWQLGSIPPNWTRGLVVLIWKREGDYQDCKNYHDITLLSVPGKELVHLLLMPIYNQLLKLQKPEQSRVMPDELTTEQCIIPLQ